MMGVLVGKCESSYINWLVTAYGNSYSNAKLDENWIRRSGLEAWSSKTINILRQSTDTSMCFRIRIPAGLQ